MAKVAFCTLVCIILVTASQAKPSGRVVGGVNASEGQFPHQISLRLNGSHFCGGSIFSPYFILTAAHCVGNSYANGTYYTYPPSSFSIRAGSTDRFSGGVLGYVTEIVAHEDYGDFLYDLALLRLKEPLIYSKNIAPISLATAEVPSGEPVIISGWGGLKQGGDLPQKLQWNTLTAITRSECNQIITMESDTVLCLAHEPNNGACGGDSGGPAIYKGQLVGVAGFVVGGCGSANPDGYAKVYSHRDWIEKHAKL